MKVGFKGHKIYSDGVPAPDSRSRADFIADLLHVQNFRSTPELNSINKISNKLIEVKQWFDNLRRNYASLIECDPEIKKEIDIKEKAEIEFYENLPKEMAKSSQNRIYGLTRDLEQINADYDKNSEKRKNLISLKKKCDGKEITFEKTHAEIIKLNSEIVRLKNELNKDIADVEAKWMKEKKQNVLKEMLEISKGYSCAEKAVSKALKGKSRYRMNLFGFITIGKKTTYEDYIKSEEFINKNFKIKVERNVGVTSIPKKSIDSVAEKFKNKSKELQCLNNEFIDVVTGLKSKFTAKMEKLNDEKSSLNNIANLLFFDGKEIEYQIKNIDKNLREDEEKILNFTKKIKELEKIKSQL